LNADYQLILEYIRKGEAQNIHQKQHKYLTICPKHNGKFKDPNERTSKTTQPFSKDLAQVKAFRLKSLYMNKVIRANLEKEDAQKLAEFI
jgi:hypothetical protein